MLSNYDFSGSGLTFSKSGNSLTITAEKAPKDDVLITVNKKNSQRKAVITWTDEKIGPQSGQLQDIVTFGQSVSDPVKAYLNVKVSLGNAKLMKVSEDGEVANVRFHISGNGISKDVTTDANGEINIANLAPGNYQISEFTDVKYVPQDTQTVTIVSGQTASVQFSNVLKKFRVNVTKQDYEKGHAQGDAKLGGAVYGLFKGNDLIAQYTTDSNGSFTTDYYVCGTDWTIKEITPSEGYLLNDTVYKVGADPKDYTVEYNNAPDMTVMEQVIKGKISIIKHTDNGDTKIETPEKGAEFQVYLKSAGSFVNADKDERDTIVCDEDGFASTKLLPYGVYTVHQTKGWAGRELITEINDIINKDIKTYK